MSSITAKTFNNVDNHVMKLYRHVSDLFDVNNVNSKFSDVQLQIGRKTFYCHKFVLSLSSKYFASLSFLSKTGTLQSVNPDYFYDVLQFMYKGEVIVTTNNIDSLLSTADILGMHDLKKVCLQFLEESLNIDNAVLYWRFANKYRHTNLASKCQTLVLRDFEKLNSVFSLINATEDMMILLLNDDNLEVKSEVEVCEMLMKWLYIQTEAGRKVHLDQLLHLIRWSGIGVDYVIESKLLQQTSRNSIGFLSKVMAYLVSGIQFEGLMSFHRQQTGLEKSLMIVGLSDGSNTSSEACRISLQHSDKVTTLDAIQTMMRNSTSACLLNNNVYVTGAGETCKETWTWNIISSWSRCADMFTGRQYHCATFVNSTLYVLGGRAENSEALLSSVECYNTKTNKWSLSGHLVYAVSNAACVTYNNSIYVFGGVDLEPADHVQVYQPAHKICTLRNTLTPHVFSNMRPVLWETSVIFLGRYACCIYNFETDIWQERKQFKTGFDYFGATLDNSIVYIAGGGTSKRDKDDHLIWTCTDEIKSVSALDIVGNHPADWKHHAKLTNPAMVQSFINISLPL